MFHVFSSNYLVSPLRTPDTVYMQLKFFVVLFSLLISALTPSLSPPAPLSKISQSHSTPQLEGQYLHSGTALSGTLQRQTPTSSETSSSFRYINPRSISSVMLFL